ncbi:MAG: hypothetical protein ACLRFO_00060 [Alphaproteobacteria bacterium]
MAKKNTIKVIGITKNDCITGIEYGLVEITVDSEREMSHSEALSAISKHQAKQLRNWQRAQEIKNAHKQNQICSTRTQNK